MTTETQNDPFAGLEVTDRVKTTPIWDFNEKPTFIGKFVEETDLAGNEIYKFKEYPSGQEYYINKCYAIDKTLDDHSIEGDKKSPLCRDVAAMLYEFNYLGKGKGKNGKTFHQFGIRSAVHK